MQVFPNNEQLSKTAFKDFVSETIKETKRLKEKSLDYSVIERTKDYLENLSNAFLILSKNAEKKKIASSGVEWFLDNYHVVLEAVELICDDLPQDYFNKLPSIDPGMKIPRVYFLARKIVSF
jgi:glycyl-tRNA synthetase beta subunit